MDPKSRLLPSEFKPIEITALVPCRWEANISGECRLDGCNCDNRRDCKSYEPCTSL